MSARHRSLAAQIRRWTEGGGLRDRNVLLLALILVLLIGMTILDSVGVTTGSFNSDYLASSLINYVPLALLALAELFVITTGRGSIDLSVGSMVSVVGMIFGILYVNAGWSLASAVVVALLASMLLGGVNGVLTAYFGYPALITTLATYYAYQSIALVITGASPISGARIAGLYSAADSIELPVIGQYFPLVPLGMFTFVLPVAVVAWLLLNRTTYGRSLYAIGTNTTAAQWAGIQTRRTQLLAFVASGLVSGLVAIYTVAQFASARPDAGTSGAGMALPAITIAVLGGVAITGGIGRLSGVLLAALLIVWLNASILIVVPGNAGTQLQFLALAVVLLGASLVDALPTRLRRRGSGADGPTLPVPTTTNPQ
ncbi:ABC transporter permease [Ruania albidiflava]|uniref:ABC transporter permease n=1 Tax=Ruania albidiflava TaxID=366586 RepID=UPI0003B48BE5|nr:ABC transporter permease [Ruania albidiflava]